MTDYVLWFQQLSVEEKDDVLTKLALLHAYDAGLKRGCYAHVIWEGFVDEYEVEYVRGEAEADRLGVPKP